MMAKELHHKINFKKMFLMVKIDRSRKLKRRKKRKILKWPKHQLTMTKQKKHMILEIKQRNNLILMAKMKSFQEWNMQTKMMPI